MIVVTISLVSANTGRVSVLGELVISNDGTGTPDRGNYDVRLGRKPSDGRTNPQRVLANPLRTGKVENYPRLTYSVWELVKRALAAVKAGGR